MLTTWNTFYASTYWNMRLSVAGAVGRACSERHSTAIGPVTLLWWAGNPTPTPITRPARLLGALVVGSRRPPSVWFEAPLSPLPFEDFLATFVFLCSF